MFPLRFPPIFSSVHCDSDEGTTVSRAASAIKTVKSAMSVPENELRRWRRLFDSNAQTVVNGEKYVALPSNVVYIMPNISVSHVDI